MVIAVETMNKTLKILPLLTFASVLLLTASSRAQVTASARITLNVVSSPGVNFTPATQKGAAVIIGDTTSPSEKSIALCSSSNVLIQLDGTGNNQHTDIDFRQGGVKTITEKDLRNVKCVEIIYLGS